MVGWRLYMLNGEGRFRVSFGQGVRVVQKIGDGGILDG
jgi:hypothetical protein